MALELSLLVARLCEMAPFAAWGTGRMRALLGEGFPSPVGCYGLVFRGASSAHPFSLLPTSLLSLPPARLLMRGGWVPQGG